MKGVETGAAPAGRRVHVEAYGEGAELIIALHGFGMRGSFFAPLSRLPDVRTVAPDLPFHGKTDWGKEAFRLVDLIDLIDQLRRESGASGFILAGQSMGARLALAASGPLMPWLRGLILIAPDGLKTSGLGWLDRIPPGVIHQLERATGRPSAWLGLLSRLKQAGLVRARDERFVRRHLSTSERRKRLFAIWQWVREASSNAGVARHLLARGGVPVAVLWGDSDPLIRAARLEKWLGPLPLVRSFRYRGGHEPNWEEVLPFLKTFIDGLPAGGLH